jgi:hypothetical protein
MKRSNSVDEQPKAKIADDVVSDKRAYFVPAHGVTVHASTAEEAGQLAKARADAPKKSRKAIKAGE